MLNSAHFCAKGLSGLPHEILKHSNFVIPFKGYTVYSHGCFLIGSQCFTAATPHSLFA